MELFERRIGHITILSLAGKLTLGEDLNRLKDKIRQLVSRGDKQIVLNLGDVTLVDSSGLGELVACYTTAWRGGATVKLASAGRRIQDLLVLTKLFTIFESYETEEAALVSFVPGVTTENTNKTRTKRIFSLAL
jgi:anti-sigma B factor antagonist